MKRIDTKYKLDVPEGIYSADTLLGLFLEIMRHRLFHLLKHGQWMD